MANKIIFSSGAIALIGKATYRYSPTVNIMFADRLSGHFCMMLHLTQMSFLAMCKYTVQEKVQTLGFYQAA